MVAHVPFDIGQPTSSRTKAICSSVSGITSLLALVENQRQYEAEQELSANAEHDPYNRAQQTLPEIKVNPLQLVGREQQLSVVLQPHKGIAAGLGQVVVLEANENCITNRIEHHANHDHQRRRKQKVGP